MTAAPPHEFFLDERKSLACIHCGLCLSSCPTYLETGNENESPRGRIYIMRALQSGRLPLDHQSVRHIDLCLGCRACEAACPSGVQYGALLEQTRDHVEKHLSRSASETFLRRVLIERIFPSRARMKLALAPGQWLKKTGLDRWLPEMLRGPLSLLPERTSSAALPELSPAASGSRRGAVGMITGCAMSAMFGATNLATVKLLNAAGFDVVAPRDQVCCGALFAHSGRLDMAREYARKNLAAFEKHQVDAIIINAAGCGSTLKEYGHLLGHDEAAQRFASKVRDLTEFLVEHGFLKRSFRRCDGSVTYHDACHLAHAQRITKAPRDLVKAVAGAAYIELPEADVCCGSAGTYNLTEPAMAARLQARKTRNIQSTGALTVVTSNPGCMLQIEAGLRKAGAANVRVRHIADFLLDAIQLPAA